ncbi:DUF4157 domain-containing protein [Sphingomonas sp. LB-2]|uniref:eCIS core domain-containing protein n=1 Tax=Sphingomonas caeni TaxID=2984949 RepID=UPI00222E13F4|nr:DUF4157 domain-containing protein [Sphingomonas caeni]MCW3846500.1 DUF4157 domain-containing protein [Sphingomonas caeni]
MSGPVHEARVPLRNPAPPILSPARTAVQRRCKNHGAGEECPKCAVQRKERGGAPGRKHAAEVDAVLANPGRPLPPALKNDMEARFGHDFSAVRIHDDAAGARAADAVDAQAFAHGNDIAFGPGRFDPDTPDGRWLIAHELAHTVQQSQGSEGVQQRGAASDGALEREADAAASAALAYAPLPPLSAAPAAVARAAKPAAKPKGKNADLTIGADNLKYNVTVTTAPQKVDGVDEVTVELLVKPFYVPRMKGRRALEVMRANPPAPLMRVPKAEDKSNRAALKQKREDTPDLRDNWLQRVGWKAAEADKLWKKCGGDSWFPKVKGEACHMDHIIELQLSGGGHPENIQALDPKPNITSGGMIRDQLADLATEIADHKTLGLNGKKRDLMMRIRFEGVKYYGDPPSVTKCVEIETQALTGGQGTLQLAPGRQPHTLLLKGGNAQFSVDDTLAALIEGDPDNDSLRIVYAGLILSQLDAPNKAGTHVLHARIDTATSRLPIKIKKSKDSDIQMNVRADTPPVLKTNKTKIPVDLLFMSPGEITEVKIDGDKINWTGMITPTHKFLPKLEIKYADEKLTVATKLDKEALAKKSPIPGAKITEASLAVQLMPEFKPEGNFAFDYDVGKRKILSTAVRVFAEDGALAADGDVTLHIPRVKSATGKIKYRQGEWSLEAKVTTGQLDLPYLKGGELTATYAKGRFGAQGTLDLDLPGNGTGQIKLSFAGGKWTYGGKGTIKHSKLGTVNVQITDDGDTFTAWGDATMGFPSLGLTPKVAAKFVRKKGEEKPRLSGTGTLLVARPKLNGSLTVTLHENGAISAAGKMKYPVRDDLTVEVGVAVDQQQNVTTTGTAKLTRPIPLFAARGGKYSMTLLNIEVPIPGVSAGPIGLKFGIGAGIDAKYWFGPAVLKDVEVGGKLNPFAPDPDPVLDFKGTLSVDAGASLGFWIKGSLIVDGGLAKAKGSIIVSAAIEAKGNASLITTAHYEKGWYALGAVAKASAELNLRFGLAAEVELTTILGSWGPGAKWEWQLADFLVPTGLGFSFSAPVSYHSIQGFTPPDAKNITWVPPQKIDAGDLLKKILDGARKSGPPA